MNDERKSLGSKFKYFLKHSLTRVKDKPRMRSLLTMAITSSVLTVCALMGAKVASVNAAGYTLSYGGIIGTAKLDATGSVMWNSRTGPPFGNGPGYYYSITNNIVHMQIQSSYGWRDAFCVEPENVAYSGDSRYSEIPNSSKAYHTISQWVHYGYDINPTEENYLYTQAKVWELASNLVLGVPSKVIFANGSGYDGYTTWEQNVQAMVDGRPDFGKTHFDITPGTSISVTDSTGLLQYGDVETTGNGLSASISGNTLTITASPTYSGDGKVWVYKARYHQNNSSAVYRYRSDVGNQEVATFWHTDSTWDTLTVSAKHKKAYIKFWKEDDSGNPVSTAKFKVEEWDNSKKAYKPARQYDTHKESDVAVSFYPKETSNPSVGYTIQANTYATSWLLVDLTTNPDGWFRITEVSTGDKNLGQLSPSFEAVGRKSGNSWAHNDLNKVWQQKDGSYEFSYSTTVINKRTSSDVRLSWKKVDQDKNIVKGAKFEILEWSNPDNKYVPAKRSVTPGYDIPIVVNHTTREFDSGTDGSKIPANSYVTNFFMWDRVRNPSGWFAVKEISVPSGYQISPLDSNGVHLQFQVNNANTNTNKTHAYSDKLWHYLQATPDFVNKRVIKEARIAWQKKDQYGKFVSGAKFKIMQWNAKTNKYEDAKPSKIGTSNTTGSVTPRYTTSKLPNKNGLDIEANSYYSPWLEWNVETNPNGFFGIVETSAPVGYLIPKANSYGIHYEVAAINDTLGNYIHKFWSGHGDNADNMSVFINAQKPIINEDRKNVRLIWPKLDQHGNSVKGAKFEVLQWNNKTNKYEPAKKSKEDQYANDNPYDASGRFTSTYQANSTYEIFKTYDGSSVSINKDEYYTAFLDWDKTTNPDGYFAVREIEAPTGYVIPKTNSYGIHLEFVFGKTTNNQTLYTSSSGMWLAARSKKPLINIIPGEYVTMEWSKIDQDNNPLAGVEFEILEWSDKEKKYKPITQQNIDISFSDNSGVYSTSSIKWEKVGNVEGWFAVKEKQAHPDYKIAAPDPTYNVHLQLSAVKNTNNTIQSSKEGNTTTHHLTSKKSIINTDKYGQIAVRGKVTKDTHKRPIKDVKFILYSKETTTEDSKVGEFITNESGQAVTPYEWRLPVGTTYWVKEASYEQGQTTAVKPDTDMVWKVTVTKPGKINRNYLNGGHVIENFMNTFTIQFDKKDITQPKRK